MKITNTPFISILELHPLNISVYATYYEDGSESEFWGYMIAAIQPITL